jgi:hypothetical protein
MGTMRSINDINDINDINLISNNSPAASQLSISDLAEVLFASSLQESDDPSPDQVRAAVEETLAACDGDCAACAACVAQEAGDHPEGYVRRMRWALRAIRTVYVVQLSLLAA